MHIQRYDIAKSPTDNPKFTPEGMSDSILDTIEVYAKDDYKPCGHLYSEIKFSLQEYEDFLKWKHEREIEEMMEEAGEVNVNHDQRTMINQIVTSESLTTFEEMLTDSIEKMKKGNDVDIDELMQLFEEDVTQIVDDAFARVI